ncbi:F-box protein At4g09920 [Quercus suber]|uniref:F-box protein At4g09920 n=1 Tax=Quercus suber TaxID=58331 RepID=UPI0032DE861C
MGIKSIPKRQKLYPKRDAVIDRFSDLSNSLLCHILSFLTTKEAVATSILSRRWKTLWTLVPKLDLDTDNMHLSLDKIGKCNEPINISSTDVLSRVLALHIAPFIRSFRLRCNSDCPPFHFDTWIRTAIARNVEELKLLIFYSYGIHMGLPCSIFYCQTLVALELSGGIDLDPPSSFQLPNLKILRLLEIYYCKDSSCFSRLLSGCPVLEDLSFERDGYDCLYHFEISVPTLKCLHIAFRPYRFDLNDYTIEIKAPALEYFKFEGDLGHIVLLEKLDNLFEADVYICSFDESDSLEESQKRCYGDRVFKLLRALTTAKFLLLFPGVTECFGFGTIYPSKFLNLVQLDFKLNPSNWHVLQALLLVAPNLEVLVVDKLAGQFEQSKAGYQRDGAPRLALGIINVIFAKPRGDAGTYSGVIFVVSGPDLEDRGQAFKKAKVVAMPTLGFSEEDKEGTF